MYDTAGGQPPKKKKRRLIWLWVLLGLLALGAAGTATVWVLFEDKIRSVMGWELPIDYTGDGNGTQVDVVISEGDIGEDVALNPSRRWRHDDV